MRIENGDPARGRALIQRYGCGACHTIDGIHGARGIVGPPLIDFSNRTIIAGEYPNTPRFLVQWLMSPPSLAPRTAMPDMGITEAEGRDIASYLFTLGAARAEVYPDSPPLPLGTRGESSGR
jgi:mono/diheme cytochrome c family protein